MEECFRCGITEEETRLFDAISDEGIVKACKNCIDREDLPTVKKPSLNQLKESEERVSIRDRLSMMAGVEKKRDSRGNVSYEKRSNEKEKYQYNLNDIIDRNLEKKKISKKSLEKLPPEKELVDNFHWKIMRHRRLKKISQEQLGKDIGESGTAIKMVESGELPEDFERLIKKLESYFGIWLFKNPSKRKEKDKAVISFDPYSSRETKIGDLKQKDNEKNELNEKESYKKEYPEQNKKRKNKLLSLFKKNNKKEEPGDYDDIEEREYGDGLYYDDLEDYNYEEYEEPKITKEQKKNDNSKEGNKEKEEDDLSQKDIDDLIFRKS
ncbi:MAG TPA: hypothetical protein VJ912_03345 [Candidatus Nanoarchaeia archaeon]|nr:hypothetical protein [Candidatus Nanoarchaeia archaeon]